MGVELRQGCMQPPLLFVFYMNWIDSHSRIEECVTAGTRRINRLFYVDDLVLLASFEQFPQHVADRFSAAGDQDGINISATKSKVLCLFRNTRQWKFQVRRSIIQQDETFKYLGVVFTSD